MAGTDRWTNEYDDAKQLADDTLALIQERNLKFPHGGQEASRVTATARRKLGTLGAAVDSMRSSLESSALENITENERNRRRDLVNALKSRREQMLQSLRRDQNSANRTALMEMNRPKAPASETLQTADLDNRGILQLQDQSMRQQDAELEELERTVTSTKHIALTVNEELDLHRRLLDDLDEDVEVTHSRMRTAQKKLKHVLARSGNCRSMCVTMLLMIALAVVVIIGFKLAAFFR
ncbi:Qc-snare protein, Syn8/Syntaxin8-family [Coccomyxa subellipsoidea C-169]|uniref:Qc-snare protein, Syn8/Syntaxin8-family n=1 Tax=Coccomyxa subellipsoidea (strain C-169) TaxID=574566 RepID=I0Z3F4_COCSC|nr:Qc-snare protein, Syn8/Syntaxin8-family [Coccomyxa subellipsoidea C-169]EIE25173.1 Qc-snare protein, Syn8/Syntaxin8-family [Coccomyxa subellipsoidea C-169]|eukprot:XP_005649717.1 Qc-snare protein, Syn8/Syntaxin8-family [Coccomyxa subellipsoidea C-169]